MQDGLQFKLSQLEITQQMKEIVAKIVVNDEDYCKSTV